MKNRIHDGREVHIREYITNSVSSQMLAALIDAEDVLFDYMQQPEYPAALLPALYKVREAIKTAEDPDRKVSVRCG
jgi:hypothetical protein